MREPATLAASPCCTKRMIVESRRTWVGHAPNHKCLDPSKVQWRVFSNIDPIFGNTGEKKAFCPREGHFLKFCGKYLIEGLFNNAVDDFKGCQEQQRNLSLSSTQFCAYLDVWEILPSLFVYRIPWIINCVPSAADFSICLKEPAWPAWQHKKNQPNASLSKESIGRSRTLLKNWSVDHSSTHFAAPSLPQVEKWWFCPATIVLLWRK